MPAQGACPVDPWPSDRSPRSQATLLAHEMCIEAMVAMANTVLYVVSLHEKEDFHIHGNINICPYQKTLGRIHRHWFSIYRCAKHIADTMQITFCRTMGNQFNSSPSSIVSRKNNSNQEQIMVNTNNPWRPMVNHGA